MREGYMVPLQDTKNINFSTSADLQKEPVDFLALAKCDGTNCVFSGDYINDDGKTLPMDYNRYAFAYTAPVDGSTLTLTITQAKTASTPHINQNDYLGKISLMDATANNINKNYTVTPEFVDGRQATAGTAVYDATADRLVF